MPNSTDNTNDATSGQEAGEAFARERASVTDRMTLREAQDADLYEGSLLERLLGAYAGEGLSSDETAELLFGDADARPSDVYLKAFLAAALPILDAAFGGPDEGEGDYNMFSREGDCAVAALVEAALQLAPEERKAFLQSGVREIAGEHPEVYDTAVRECIAAAVGDPSLAYGALARSPP
jgi:hypothetical protein